MAFLLNGQPLAVDVPFTDADGIQRPANWLRLTTEEEKAAIGITWVPDPEPVDHRFYWDRDADGTLIPKRLEDEPAVNENGDPILDADGKQLINKGLKSEWIAQQKYTAGTLLAPTDWCITRKVDTGIEVPANIKQYRDEIRVTCGLREDQIAQCSTTDQLVALLTNPSSVYDPTSDKMVPNTEPFILPWPSQGQ